MFRILCVLLVFVVLYFMSIVLGVGGVCQHVVGWGSFLPVLMVSSVVNSALAIFLKIPPKT